MDTHTLTIKQQANKPMGFGFERIVVKKYILHFFGMFQPPTFPAFRLQSQSTIHHGLFHGNFG